MADLLWIVPSRSRAGSVARLVEAWHATGAADDGAALLFAVDADDPQLPAYRQAVGQDGTRVRRGVHIGVTVRPRWTPMVHKLNAVAVRYADLDAGFRAIGFGGDDHVPRTPGWAGRFLAALDELRTGIVYGDDGYQGKNLPTHWAMTADIVRALGRMVPAPVEHLYCDNAVRDLGQAAGCLRYLPDVLIEHMHPAAKKAVDDDQYRRVNGRDQYRRDRRAYQRWRRDLLPSDAEIVRTLRS